MPTSLHRRAQRDASAKRRRSWVQRASEAPDGQDHDLPGVRCPSRFARKPRLRAIAFLEAQFGNLVVPDMLPCVTTLK